MSDRYVLQQMNEYSHVVSAIKHCPFDSEEIRGCVSINDSASAHAYTK